MVLSRGLTGMQDSEPKVSVAQTRIFPAFGEFLGEGEMACLTTYEVKRVGGKVFIQV